MELHISDIQLNNGLEQIPENMSLGKAPIKINKVRFDESQPQQVVKPSLSGVKARMVRPQTPAPKSQISYDDILAKMGMFVADGQLHLLDGKPQQQVQQIKKQIQVQPQVEKQVQPQVEKQVQPQVQVEPSQQNSYIYNKYFKNEANDGTVVRSPQTIMEYRDMLIYDIIQKQRAKQIKSTKLIMPTSNINFSQRGSGNLNRLFSFSQR